MTTTTATPPEHTLCTACGSMACEHFTAELRELRAASSRYYEADGRVLDLPPAEVVRRRKAAATALDAFSVLITRLAALAKRWRNAGDEERADELDAAVRDLLTTQTQEARRV